MVVGGRLRLSSERSRGEVAAKIEEVQTSGEGDPDLEHFVIA